MTYPQRSSAHATIFELDSVTVKDKVEQTDRQIRTLRLVLNGVTLEICSLGASITRLLLPTSSDAEDDDVVLGYDSVAEMYDSQNPVYFGVISGRVANRIQQGRFQTMRNGKVYQLDINDHPNHLHGGVLGFSKRVWDAEIIGGQDGDDDHKQVKFSLISTDGDQGYPGTVKVSATYSLQPSPSEYSVKILLSMTAELLDDTPSPINLTQHSYFNLAGHDSANAILDHSLRLYCDAYTPTDGTSIPTREVRSLDDDPVMDWRSSRSLRQALTDYGLNKMDLSIEQVQADLFQRVADAANSTTTPCGFDQNYVVRRASASDRHDDGGLSLVAVLKHAHRRLTIRSTQPGVQLYTANFLDGKLPTNMKAFSSKEIKSGYRHWQGLCLETQHFPDSILVDCNEQPEFAAGQCPILTPQLPRYTHSVEFTFENGPPSVNDVGSSMKGFYGTDSDGNHYHSVEEMWEEQGVANGISTSWYERAASYYKENCPSTVDGVLGGFSSITELDLAGSNEFIGDLVSVRPAVLYWVKGSGANGQKCLACECGAGLGRVTKGLLLPLKGIDQCDLVESSATLLSAAPQYLGDAVAAQCRFFCFGLQHWKPTANTYSLVWIQWVLSYLTDDDIVEFLQRCGESLVEDGVVILKENMCEDSDFEVDCEDASVTRSLRYWKCLIQRAGLRIFHERMQDSLPDNIYPVTMLALERE